MTGESEVGLAGAAKAISDLDALIQGILLSLPDGKPWQRQLRFLLANADRSLLVMRVTISLQHEHAEVIKAAQNVWQS